MESLIKTLLNSDNYQASIKTILEKCAHKTKVRFALHCATDLEKYYDTEKYPEVKKTRAKCLELVVNWLLDSSSVTKKELDAAANAAYAVVYAAYAVVYAAHAAHAVVYAAHAAHAVAYAAHAAAYAANAAGSYDESIKQAHLKGLFYYLVKLYLTETDKNFKEETFNLLYLNKG